MTLRRGPALLLAVVACARVASTRPPVAAGSSGGEVGAPRGRNPRSAGEARIRVLLASTAAATRISSAESFVFVDGRDQHVLAHAPANQQWRVERDGARVRAVRPDGVPTIWVSGTLIARSEHGVPLAVGRRPYRGELRLSSGDSGIVVVNALAIDEYLRGVVPLEMGSRVAAESAAVQAQAVAARSYAFIRLAPDGARPYDVTSGVLDQAYGGVAAERPIATDAIASTRGLVLMYGGRAVNAPYHSACGGSTAAASEVWRSPDEAYLQSVSDRIPGTDRYYCDRSPRFNWTRVIEGATLEAALARYLATYTAVPGRAPGAARDVAISARTRSGRVGMLTITTARGNFLLRGNDIRFVLRPPGGEILNSTYFSVETTAAGDGTLARLTIRGAGNGHGVGMCQWGAIGRARAGQDFRTILRTYYPGTILSTAD
jgi:stage II sporulation protein D (peptidoglycan lytic transglycosylase)